VKQGDTVFVETLNWLRYSIHTYYIMHFGVIFCKLIEIPEVIPTHNTC